MYNVKILNEAVSSIIAIADSVSDDCIELSMVYHLLKFIRATIRDFPDNDDHTTVDLLNAYAAKIKRSTNGEFSKFITLNLHANNEKGEAIPLPITNANEALLHLIQQNLRGRNRDNYSAVHNIADLYLRKFFEYSDWLDAHPDVENCELKQIMLTAFCSELGLHIGWLEDAMKFEEIPYDDIIV